MELGDRAYRQTDSSGLPDIAESDELSQSYDLPHSDRLTPGKVLYFSGC